MTGFDCSELSDPEVGKEIFAEAESMLCDMIPDNDAGLTTQQALARRLAQSRRKVLTLRQPLKIGITFAMWKEVTRLLPKSAGNPHGEDSLRVKIRSLDWLFSGTPITWRLYPVDDGCPEASYETALSIAATSGGDVSVLRLADALQATTGPLGRLACVDASVKGGSIIAGLSKALEDGCTHIGYTDCDNSVNLGQLGLLLHPLAAEGRRAALGDRNAPGSFVIRHESRRQFRMLRHMMLILGNGKVPFADIPSPFKLFDAEFFRTILPRLQIFDFSFEYDVVLNLYKTGEHPAIVDYAFLDSFENSAWHSHGEAFIWLRQFRGLLNAMESLGDRTNPLLANLIRTRITTEGDMKALLDAPEPASIAHSSFAQIGRPDLMADTEIVEWALQALAGASGEPPCVKVHG